MSRSEPAGCEADVVAGAAARACSGARSGRARPRGQLRVARSAGGAGRAEASRAGALDGGPPRQRPIGVSASDADRVELSDLGPGGPVRAVPSRRVASTDPSVLCSRDTQVLGRVCGHETGLEERPRERVVEAGTGYVVVGKALFPGPLLVG